MLIKIIALQVAWCGCLLIYCAARQQLLLQRPLPLTPAWALFVATAIIAMALLLAAHHPLTATIFVLCVWMLAWILLALVVPYLSNARHIVPAGSALFLLSGLLGGAHVV